MFCKHSSGQTFIEYTLLIGILVMVLIAMTPMMRRGIQAMVKVTADQVGNQRNADQIGGRFGQMVNSVSYTDVQQEIERKERVGVTGKEYLTDKTYTQSSIYLNQGFLPSSE